jgi:hypothetical protein
MYCARDPRFARVALFHAQPLLPFRKLFQTCSKVEKSSAMTLSSFPIHSDGSDFLTSKGCEILRFSQWTFVLLHDILRFEKLFLLIKTLTPTTRKSWQVLPSSTFSLALAWVFAFLLNFCLVFRVLLVNKNSFLFGKEYYPLSGITGRVHETGEIMNLVNPIEVSKLLSNICSNVDLSQMWFFWTEHNLRPKFRWIFDKFSIFSLGLLENFMFRDFCGCCPVPVPVLLISPSRLDSCSVLQKF